jgi:trehalose 6-phosphate phosphatase
VPALLRDLAGPFELVAVVSGRPPAFLEEVLGDPHGVELVGLYGLARALGGTAEAKSWVESFAARQAAERDLAVHPGRMELELRPPIRVDKGTVVHALVAEHARRLRAVAAFGDDIGDLPAFAAVGELTDPAGAPFTAVRVAAVDHESPPEVAARADLTVRGAAGAVEVLRALADAAARVSDGGAGQPA